MPELRPVPSFTIAVMIRAISLRICMSLFLTACTIKVAPSAPTPSSPIQVPSPTLEPTATAVPTAAIVALPVFEAIDAATQVEQMKRGMNFGNALEAPSEGEWGITIQDSDIVQIRHAGFSNIRVPTRWSAHALSTSPYTVEHAFLERLGHVASVGLSQGLIVIINMQHYEEFFADYDGHRVRFVEMWRQIADYFKAYPAGLVFELLNEPHDALAAGPWNTTLADALTAIRKTNPTRNIVIGGVEYNSIHALDLLKLPDDPHLIVTFHYYSPMSFTHQGAEWMAGSDQWLGTDWEGSSHDKGSMDFDLDVAAQWGKAHKRPIWMGEFGAYNKADLQARARWTSYLARAAEHRGFAWSYWEYASGFGAFNRSTSAWIPELLQALQP